MTLKFFKKLLGLENFLKEVRFIEGNKKVSEMIFQ
jgi:hypothetical protein